MAKQPIKCPKCGAMLEGRKGGCPQCGYSGYIPMSDEEIKRTKLILYPVFAVLAAIVILAIWLLSQ